METMNDLRALLLHDTQLLLSAEEQLLEALPVMRDKASNPALKQALDEHLEQTRMHCDRLNRMRQQMNIREEDVTKYTGVLATVMSDPTTCRGMRGLIEEGQQLMAENLSPEVMDAAIIGSCQKVEHFEIAAYGTARSFAEQLGLTEMVNLLQQTLDEEYTADRRLTDLAESHVNQEAEMHR